MTTIRDHKLFTQLQRKPEWETLFNADNTLINDNIPELAGGLDHIHTTRSAIQFHDIGCNGKDNSFRICDQELFIVCYNDDSHFGTPWHLYTVEQINTYQKPKMALDAAEFREMLECGKYRFLSLQQWEWAAAGLRAHSTMTYEQFIAEQGMKDEKSNYKN